MYIEITYNIGTTSRIVDRFSQDLCTKKKHILLIGGRIAFWFSGFFAATDGSCGSIGCLGFSAWVLCEPKFQLGRNFEF